MSARGRAVCRNIIVTFKIYLVTVVQFLSLMKVYTFQSEDIAQKQNIIAGTCCLYTV